MSEDKNYGPEELTNLGFSRVPLSPGIQVNINNLDNHYTDMFVFNLDFVIEFKDPEDGTPGAWQNLAHRTVITNLGKTEVAIKGTEEGAVWVRIRPVIKN